jgi:hypothetical protein
MGISLTKPSETLVLIVSDSRPVHWSASWKVGGPSSPQPLKKSDGGIIVAAGEYQIMDNASEEAWVELERLSVINEDPTLSVEVVLAKNSADGLIAMSQTITLAAGQIAVYSASTELFALYELVGIIGPAGPAGADGKTVLNGTIDPTTEGSNGDFYIQTTSKKIHGPKAGGVWPAGVSLVGPKGDDGADGLTILNGTSDPTTEGVDGDFFIQTTSKKIFGPKATTWPAGVSLVGPSGSPGVDGLTILNGTSDPTTEGVDGDFFIQTTSKKIFGPKATTWPAGVSLVGPAGTNGNQTLTGTAVPTTEGVDGDLYFRADTGVLVLYGPKAGGSWGSGVVIV